MKIAIKSFLWVSSAYDEPGAAAYQIDVVESADDADPGQFMADVAALGGQTTRVRRGLNVAQATALGIDLTAIAEALNVDALAAVQDAAEQAQALRDDLAATATEAEEARLQLIAANSALTAARVDLAASNAAGTALADQVRALTEQVRALEAQLAP